MADVLLRLDTSKVYSECRGDRTPDDPHYRVHYWQGVKLGKVTVLMPFDAEGHLVPDDGKTEPYEGKVEGRVVMHQPLYTEQMREVLKKLSARASGNATPETATPAGSDNEGDGDGDNGDGGALDTGVNFVAWLKGEAKYQPHELRKAALERYSRNFPKIYPDLVVELVLDEKVVPEAEVCADLRKHLPKAA